MNAANKSPARDPFFGYFASVAIALFASAWIAGLIFAPVAELSKHFPPEGWRANIAAGLFMGIIFANPVGVLIAKTSIIRSALRLVLGIVVGMITQITIVAPFAGDGMSHFLFFILAVLAVPAFLLLRQVLNFLFGPEMTPTEAFSRIALWVLHLPDRIIFIILMSASFTVFWRYEVDTNHLLIGFAGALVLITSWVAYGLRPAPGAPDPAKTDIEAWLELDPEAVAERLAAEKARTALNRLGRVVLPGAILLGGVTRLSADAMLRLYPSMSVHPGDPSATLRTIGIVAASGLGLIFVGMLVLLAFSLTLLFVIGRLRSWSAHTFRERSRILIAAMQFRSIRKT